MLKCYPKLWIVNVLIYLLLNQILILERTCTLPEVCWRSLILYLSLKLQLTLSALNIGMLFTLNSKAYDLKQCLDMASFHTFSNAYIIFDMQR